MCIILLVNRYFALKKIHYVDSIFSGCLSRNDLFKKTKKKKHEIHKILILDVVNSASAI